MLSNDFLKWVVVAGGFISYFLGDGCTYSAGILFTEFKGIFNASSAATSLLPAMIYAIPQFMSPFICIITEIVGYSTAAAWGAFFLCTSFIVTSFAQEIGLTYFAYGVLMSLGLQLTYTSALMSVVATFKNHPLFGLACGIMMCGGGIGAFATNHLIAWILSIWTWREALIIQGGVFLHAWISAALFYWFDERSAIDYELEKYNAYLAKIASEGSHVVVRKEPPVDVESVMSTTLDVSKCRSFVNRLKALWFLCPIFMILTPSHQRPRALKDNRLRTTPEETYSVRISKFCSKLGASLGQLLSPGVWRNTPFLVYVLTNAMAAAGVVIPWTFCYDYIRNKWLAGVEEGVASVSGETQLAWYPSLIGLGSCTGQVLFGLLISKVYNPAASPPISIQSGDTSNTMSFGSHRRSRPTNLLYVFAAVLFANGLFTIGFTYVSIPSTLATGKELIFSTSGGQLLAVVCFLVGITDGAFMTLLGPMLEHYLDAQQFPAGLGICLCISGAFNLAGTLLGGYMFDVYGSYFEANLLGASLPLGAFIILTIFSICYYHGGLKTSMVMKEIFSNRSESPAL